MDQQLIDKISKWFDAHAEELTADIIRIVRIPSISDPNAEEKPFGKPCQDVLKEMLEIGEEHGFYTENYENYVGSIGQKEKDWNNMIGLWNHLDVVPVGADWTYEPFEPVRMKHFLIGRGAQDNKGPAVGMLYVMQCLRELEIPLKHELCLFVGCDEERAMEDLEYYTKHYPVPKLSIIADCGFPVCYGEKGILEGHYLSKELTGSCILEAAGGSAANMIPDTAKIVFKREPSLEKEIEECIPNHVRLIVEKTQDAIEVTAHGTAKHSAFPEGSINAIYELCNWVRTLKCLPTSDREIFSAVCEVSEEYYGKNTGIMYEDEISGKTTCAATMLKLLGRKLDLNMNIRYAITSDGDILQERLAEYGRKKELQWKTDRNLLPNYFPREHPAVELLTRVYNELADDNKESFVMGGGSYARKLPGAFAYGLGGMAENEQDKQAKKELFLPKHGDFHQPDEALNLRLLIKGLKIYTAAMIAMNDCDL